MVEDYNFKDRLVKGQRRKLGAAPTGPRQEQRLCADSCAPTYL